MGPTNSPVRLGVSPAASSPTGFYSLRLYFPSWNPELCSLSHSPVVPPGLSSHKCGTACSTSCCLTRSATCHLAVSPLCPGCSSVPILSVWMNVSSLTPWLSDFHTVRFSVCPGCFLFLNLLLSFLWLCEEAQCTYLHLHLGWKSKSGYATSYFIGEESEDLEIVNNLRSYS